jgi:hypothetical protein
MADARAARSNVLKKPGSKRGMVKTKGRCGEYQRTRNPQSRDSSIWQGNKYEKSRTSK